MSKKMTQTELLDALVELTDYRKADLRAILKSLAVVIADALSSGRYDKVSIPGLATISKKYVKARKKRPGVNPFTGEKIMIKAKPAHYKVKALPSKSLKDAVK